MSPAGYIKHVAVLIVCFLTAIALGQNEAGVTSEPTNESDLEFFGPVHQPDRVIEMPMSGIFTRADLDSVDLEGDTLFIAGVAVKANVWAMIVWYWPEAALVVTLLLVLWLAWRVRRLCKNPQAPGEPHCRKCAYQLTGTDAKDCPECGVSLKRFTPIIGKRHRYLPALIAMLVLLGGGGYLAYRWYPPNDPMAYGLGSDLPREGTVSTWFDWHTGDVSEWDPQTISALTQREHGLVSIDQFWQIELETVGQHKCLFDSFEADPPGDEIFPNLRTWDSSDLLFLSSIQRAGGVRLYDAGFRRHLFDAKRGIYASIPGGRWPNPYIERRTVRYSHDGRYLFDVTTFKQIVRWDTHTWTDPLVCPQDVYFPTKDGDPAIPSVYPIPGRSAAVIIWPGALGNWHIALWNVEANTVQAVPEFLLNYTLDLDHYAFTYDNRFVAIIANERDSVATIFDLENVKPGEEEPLAVPWAETQFPVSGEQPRVVAIAQQGHVAFVYHSKKGYFKWNLESNGQLESVQRPDDQHIHWIRSRYQSNVVATTEPAAIEVEDDSTDGEVELIPTPVKVEGTGMGSLFGYLEFAAGVRLIYGRVDDCIVIYDRKTKKWLGRFKTRPYNGNKPDEVVINQDATLLVVVPDNEDDPILVFELPQRD